MVKISKWVALLVAVFAYNAVTWVSISEAAAPANYSQGVTKDSIKIGMFSPFSGTAALYGKIVRGAQAIYMDQNEKGGINGRRLEFVVEDDAGNPANAPVVFRKLAERDKVFMIHGGTSSAITLAMRPLIQESGIPLLVASSVADKITDPPLRNLFTGHPCTADMASVVAEFARSINPKRIAVITQNDEWGKGWREPFVKTMKRSGIEIVSDEEVNTEIGDATSLVRTVMRQRADAVALLTYPQPASVFLRDAYAQGLRLPIVTGTGAMPEDILRRLDQREPLAQFFSTYLLKYQVNSPEYEPYRKMMAKYFPKDIYDAQVMGAMTGALANIEVLKRLGNDLTWDGWIKTMENLKDFDTPVLASSVTYKPFDPRDPNTRRGVKKTTMMVLNPDPKGAPVLIVKDWAEYQKIIAK